MKTDQKVWDWRSHIIYNGPENATYRHVLLTLSCYMDSAGGSCFPSITELVKATRLSKPSVVKYLSQAREDGWIRVKKHGFRGQQWSRNEYTASLPESAKMSKKAVKDVNRVEIKAVKDVNRVEIKAVKQVNQRRLTSFVKAVKQVNSISPYNSPRNSPEGARPRECPEKLHGVPVPDKLRQTDGFAEAYEKWWEYNRQAFSRFPNIFTIEQQFRKLIQLSGEGNDPVQVIRQSMEHQSKSFYPIRDDFEPERGSGGASDQNKFRQLSKAEGE